MTHLIELDSAAAVKLNAPLWHSPANQLRRKIGPYVTIYSAGAEGGTVRDQQGKCFDWWLTDVVLPGNFNEIRVVEAR